MGEAATKYGFLVRVVLKYFLSIKQAWQMCSLAWKKYYQVGRVEPIEFNEKEKYIILHHKDFKIHPILCTYLYWGIFVGFGRFTAKTKKITVEESKRMFKGDPYHEIVMRWE